MSKKVTERHIIIAHELGHALVARKHGIKDIEIKIGHDGDGVTNFEPHEERYTDSLEIDIAGFVAEEMFQGRDPIETLDNFFIESQYTDDVKDICDTVEEGHLDACVQIPAAIKRVKKMLTDNDVVKESTILSRKLHRTGHLEL
jgi:hypothetical protein